MALWMKFDIKMQLHLHLEQTYNIKLSVKVFGERENELQITRPEDNVKNS